MLLSLYNKKIGFQILRIGLQRKRRGGKYKSDIHEENNKCIYDWINKSSKLNSVDYMIRVHSSL